jgi:Pyridoxamine 5'-phosphate oxidase
VARWAELASDRPDLAEAGAALLYQFGVGLGYLATVRPDGGPRLHPICPMLHEGGLYAFLIPSPKREDLARDPRYALHSFPTDDNEDAFSMTGTAHPIEAPELRSELVDRFLAERPDLTLTPAAMAEQSCLELDVDACLLTRTTGHGDPDPVHTVWHAPRTAGARRSS